MSGPMARTLAAAGLTTALVCGPVIDPAGVVAGPAPQVAISADAMNVDATTRIATAAGRVRISDGTTTATAARAMLYHREGRGVLSGQARAAGPQGVLEGDEIIVEYTTAAITKITARGRANLEVEGSLVSAQMVTIVPATDTVTALRDVTFYTQPDIVARGTQLVYQRLQGTATLEGRAHLQNRDGFVEGDRIDSFKRWERLVVTGGVHGAYRDIEVRSRAAEVLAAERKAVFTGEVQLSQPGRRMTAEKVTVWYGSRRVEAEGQIWIRIEPTP